MAERTFPPITDAERLALTPHDHVFKSLRNLLLLARSDEDLNAQRGGLARSLENIISWETLLVPLDPSSSLSEAQAPSR